MINDTDFPEESSSPSPSLPLSQSPLLPIPDSLPPMTRTEATFHASVAGVRAASAAKAQGGDPSTASALGLAAQGGKQIGPLLLQLPSAYSALAVPAMGRLLETHGLPFTGIQGDCLFIAAFVQPREVHRLACVQADRPAAEALLRLAEEIALTLEYRELIDEALEWCMAAFQRLNGVKKPSPGPAGPGPAATPATDAPPTGITSSAASPEPPIAAAPAGSSPSSMP